LDRLARSTHDLFGITKKVEIAEATFRSIREPWADRRHRKVCSLSSAKEEHFANLVGFSSSTPFFRVAEVQWALV
jgi:hypothetical protein